MRIFAQWDRFKGLRIQSFAGMTVNERRFALGLMGEFDNAVARKDIAQVRAVLGKCIWDDANIEQIVKIYVD